MYSQIIIRCYTDHPTLPKGYEKITIDGSSVWICEPEGQNVEIEENQAKLWLEKKLTELKAFQQNEGFSLKTTVFVEISKDQAPHVLKLSCSILNLLSHLGGEVEIFLSD